MRFALLALLLVSQLTLAATPAEPYPAVSDEEWERWERILVVADIEPGQYHQRLACPANHLCTDPPPYWFKVKVRSTIYGAPVPDEIRVSTTSHYGMEQGTKMRGPVLLSLRTNRDTFIMPRYASALLGEDAQGTLTLKKASQVYHWLPCIVPRADIPIERLRELLQNAGRDLEMNCPPPPAPQPVESK